MNLDKKSRILITGGHMTPALAVLDELKKKGFQRFIWVGHKHNQSGTKEVSAEYKIVTEKGVNFIDLKTGKLVRKWTLETLLHGLKNLFLIFWGFLKSTYIILRFRPHLVISFGGYLALPIVIVGKIFGRKVVTHEQTIVVGLANKIIAKFADKIFISWESSKKYFPKNKTILIGNPIRKDVFEVRSKKISKQLDKNLPTLYITGGNQGAHEINKRVFRIIPKLLEDCNIIHQTGNSTVTKDFDTARKLQENLPSELKDRYVVRDYVYPDEIGEVFSLSDVLFSRCGANTMGEVLALGKMSILMPIPWSSHNEQFKNAYFVAETGLGYVLEQKESLSPNDVYKTILFALNNFREGVGFNGRKLSEVKKEAKDLVKLDAGKELVKQIYEL